MNKFIMILPLSFLLFACNPQEQNETINDSISFEDKDECHVCGMLIIKFNGPKAQAFVTRDNKMRKFCSTIEMVYWYLQPENKSNVAEIYVHNMSESPWSTPDDQHLIPADEAFFVIGSDMKGAMGKTLATFQDKKEAILFATEHSGKIVTFNELSLELLANH